MEIDPELRHMSAFPLNFDETENGEEGMTLRDYFAAKAMQAYITGDNGSKASTEVEGGYSEYVAKCAYMVADAMLLERGK